jgi:hypothetical protein
MSEFNSPNFKKTVQQAPGQRPMREFNVLPPEMENQPKQYNFSSQDQEANDEPTHEEIEAAFQEARKHKQESVNKVSSFGKQRMELLAGIGRLTKDVQIDSTVFSIRTLKAFENREVIRIAYSEANALETLFEGRRQRLARSICKIDGSDIDTVLSSSKLEDKLNLVDNLEEKVIQKLSEEFDNLNKEANDKYGISTEKDVKEVTEDIKK